MVPLKHFDLRIASRTLVRASRPPPSFPAVHAVSNLDLVLGPFPLYLICVYGPPPCGLGAVLAAPSAGALDMYMGNVVTYASHEASVSDLRRMPLHDVAATVRAAITAVMTKDRFQDLVDWAEENKAAYKDGGKWTEEVNLGLGSPALVISGFVPFAIDGDLGELADAAKEDLF
ncbi:hypothetical protein TRIUR3_10445 [Triticum urartu]|uniref:Uncharacterized protein n=1 Tax=Triticum urartu TaxID=4572 RepID=M8A519_TRIUA|nr:hypothetical protein TRIUR3_10445 [Triticum urartu]